MEHAKMEAAVSIFDMFVISELANNNFCGIAPAAIELADAIEEKLQRVGGKETEMEVAIRCREFADHMKKAGEFVKAFADTIGSTLDSTGRFHEVNVSNGALSEFVKRMKE